MINSAVDSTYVKEDGIDVIYLAGGCFWGMEKLMQEIPGVVRATNGYANGHPGEIPTYEAVCTGRTGYRETVRVEYNPLQISLSGILFAYFCAIDPTVKNRQGADIGSQYQTGIYYIDDASERAVKIAADEERGRHAVFAVEIKPLESFYDAEEYHQDYLYKNPGGYCHISPSKIGGIVKSLAGTSK